MSKKQQPMCPLFEDVVCPQGQDAVDSCQVRLDGDFDPMSAYKDYVFMNCAIRRAREQDPEQKVKDD